MARRTFLFSLLCAGSLGLAVLGQVPVLPPGDAKPFPRPIADGPTSFVTSAAFSPDGKTLYVGGWDKQVHVWRLNGKGKFAIDRAATYRVPVGPGSNGSINALALSPDGQWLAVAGNGMIRGSTLNLHSFGVLLPSMPRPLRLDRGMIYVFNTRTRAVKILRGHEGTVIAMTFAQGMANGNQPPPLVSAAQEWADTEYGMVRYWNIATGKNSALKLPKTSIRPGLAAWKQGKGVRVGIAWDDGKFRIWANEGLHVKADGRRNNTVVYSSGLGRAITGSFTTKAGWLQAWQTTAGQAPTWDEGKRIAFSTIRKTNAYQYFSPRALTLFSSRPGGPQDYAAVIHRSVYKPDQGLNKPDVEDDRMQIVRMVGGKWTTENRPPIIVARGGGAQPVVAASPGGRHLVVAGNRTHDVLVYSIQDLLQNRVQPQVLNSSGQTIRYAAFVRNAKNRGLVLNAAAKQRPGQVRTTHAPTDLLFNFNQRKLSDQTQGWKVEVPDTGLWKAEWKPKVNKDNQIVGSFIQVSNANRQVSAIDIDPRRQVTDIAMYPPQQNIPALVAVASHQRGQPRLQLFDARNGNQFLNYNGHTGRIRSIAFSEDGKLLVTASEDQMVAVWSVAETASVLGRHGMLAGLQIRDGAAGDVIVTQVDAESPAKGKLRVGEVITGLVENGKLMPFKSERDYYIAIWQMPPGEKLTLRVKNRGDVGLQVGQGIREQYPLFSLFVTRDQRNHDWLAWSPTGPYDASRPEAERLLGWHINTGKPDAPTRFAEANQYKKEYYRPDILRFLVQRGRLDQALEDWNRENKIQKQGKNLPEPQMNLRVAEAGPNPVQVDGVVQVRKLPQTLKLAVDNLAPEDILSVHWQITGFAGSQPFDFLHGREWTGDVSDLKWRRGVYQVRAELQTLEDTPRKFVHQLQFRYQPPAPQVEVPPGPFLVEKPEFVLKAKVVPSPEQKVLVKLIHRHQGKEVSNQAAALTIDKKIKLKPGRNLIEVMAINQGVPAGFENLETERRVVEVNFTPPVPDPLPLIALEYMVPLYGMGKEGQPVRLEPGQTVTVDAARVRVRGRIQAEKNLAEAAWKKAIAPRTEALTGFMPNQKKILQFEQEIDLQPGAQQFQFTAKTAKSERATAAMTAFFRPPLPELVIVSPDSGTNRFEGKDPAEEEVVFQVVGYNPDHPFETVVLVNDQPLPKVRAVLDAKAGNLRAKVPLTHGDNRIQLRLRNQWKVEQTSNQVIQVRYLRPPRILKLTGPAESEKPLVDVTASVASALPLKPGLVEAEVQSEKDAIRRKITLVEVKKPAAGQTWTVVLKDVPLEVGSNKVVMHVSNSEARSLKPAELALVYKKKAPPRPVVEFLFPRNDVTLTSRDHTLQLRVSSRSPLRRLELVRLGNAGYRQPIDVSRIKPTEDGLFQMDIALKLSETPATPAPVIDLSKAPVNPQGFREAKAGLSLVNGSNNLRLEAVNDSGQAEAGVVIGLLSIPVQLIIDSIEPRGWKGETIESQTLDEGLISFNTVPQGRVWLQGRVIWDKEKDAEVKKLESVQVYVNGLRQPMVELEASIADAPSRVRMFRVPIALTKSQSTVEVELPGLKVDAGTRRRFVVGCKKPSKQRLHLLIVGVDEKNERRLATRVLNGLHAQSIDWEHGRFEIPNFSEGRLYPVLSGYVRPGQVLTELRRIKDEIDVLARAGLTSDVVVVYFAGQSAQQGIENYCLTSVSKHIPNLRRSAIALRSLESCLSDTLGAQLVMLDVSRAGKPAKVQANWLNASRVGLVCYERQGNQTASPLRLEQALAQTISRANTLGSLAGSLRAMATGIKSLQCHENITGGHLLQELPFGSRQD